MSKLKNLYPGMTVNVINPYDNKKTLKAEVKQVYPRYAVVQTINPLNSRGEYTMAVDEQSIVDNPIISAADEFDADY